MVMYLGGARLWLNTNQVVDALQLALILTSYSFACWWGIVWL